MDEEQLASYGSRNCFFFVILEVLAYMAKAGTGMGRRDGLMVAADADHGVG